MTFLQNNYEDLLGYLKKEQLPSKSFLEEAVKLNNSQEKIEDFDIHSDVKIGRNPVRKSKGFDVLKFEDLLKSKLIEEYKRLQDYERPYISVTELLSCVRKTFYERMKYKIDLDKMYSYSYLYLINKVGEYIHKIFQDLIGGESEKTIISEKYKIKGRVDTILENILLEYKTIDESKFKNTYIESHYHQALIYVYILNTEYNYKLELITIVYILRNIKKIVPFDLQLNNEIAISFIERAKIIRNSIDKKIVPDKIGSDQEQCKWCLYKKYCISDSNKKTACLF